MKTNEPENKSLSSRKEHFLYAISVDRETDTIDLMVFDHDTGNSATLYLPPALAEQMAEDIVNHIQSLRES